jgi:hypothetical protein
VQDLQIQEPISPRLALRPSFHRRRETFTGIPGSGWNPSAIHSVTERFWLKRYLPPLIKT